MTEHIPEIRSRCLGNDTCLPEPANASGPAKTSSEGFSSTIEFYVRSDEGIYLYVDLNSNPSDWTERLKNEVNFCESVYRDKCQHQQQNLCWFKRHKEITSSFQLNNHADPIQGDDIQVKSPSSSNLMINNFVEIDQPDEPDLFIISSTIMSHAINTDACEHLNEEQTLMSCETDFDVQIPKLSGSEFCAAEDKCEMTLDIDINDTFRTKTKCDLISCGPSSPAMLEHQTSVLESEIGENSTLQDSCSILNLSVGDPESSAAGSLEMQSSDIEQCPKDVSCSPYGAFYLGDIKNVSDSSLPTFPQKWERCNIGIAMESSVCSQLPDCSEKMLPVSDDLESNGAHKRKRKLVENATCHQSAPVRRVLRSAKHNVKEVLPRRSRRLISKAVSS